MTRTDGQARLPCRPTVVVHLLAVAVGAATEGLTRSALVDRVTADTGEDRGRVDGLAAWLPLSHVAVWHPQSGHLVLNPATDLADLAMRYAAWAGSQPVPSASVDALKDYARAIVEEAVAVARRKAPAEVEAVEVVVAAGPVTATGKAGGSGRGGIGDRRQHIEPHGANTRAAGADEAAWRPSSASRSEVEVVDVEAELVDAGGGPMSAADVVPSPYVAPEPEPVDGGDPLVPAELTGKIRRLLNALDAAFLERRRHTRASLLALLSGQHVLLLGPPGTAKSMLARALCRCFAGARYFEYLLSRFTHPDELFGPVSIPGLKEEDYRRLTEGFLPSAHVAFLDEIFKANSAILNSLLTLVNERVFHHGRHRDPVPLIALVGASNELPDPEGGLQALYDRFLVRLTVPPIAEPPAFLAVATGDVRPLDVAEADALTADDRATLAAAADRVDIPEGVQHALVALWKRATKAEWEVSDRRWRQAVGMLRVAAAADGRRRLVPLDLLLLEPVLAPTPERAAEVREAILEHLGQGALPKHDLRTQWLLMQTDRTAPLGPERPQQGVLSNRWPDRLARRREHVERVLQHHARAVERLSADRARLEAAGDEHLWIDVLPVQLLSAHIEASRDLARILEVAEGYRDALRDPARVARALIESLPHGTRRVYGSDAVCTLSIADAGVHVGLTLAGECVALGATTERGTAGGVPGGPVLQVQAGTFLDWIDGRLPTETVLGKVPSWASRNAGTALESVRRLLGGEVIPKAPELPQP